MAEQSVTLNPGESKVVSFEATPAEARTYQVEVDGLTGSFVATAAIIEALVTAGFFRNPKKATSIYYSGWTHVTLNTHDVDLTQIGRYLQAGFIWQNNSGIEVTVEPVVWHKWWRKVDGQEYVTDPPFTLPTQEPAIIPPAPTGLPYSSGAYECDKYTPPGSKLEPGKKGFIYTPVFTVSARWNYIYINLVVNGVSKGVWHIGGWGGY